VIVDFKLAQEEVENTCSKLLAEVRKLVAVLDTVVDQSVRIFKGDDREVIEGTDVLLEGYEEEFGIFTNVVRGFVLNESCWAQLDTTLLTPLSGNEEMFEALQLPTVKKKALIAHIRSHSRKNLNFDVIKGKGQGVIIMLYGQPGLGKTFTAEALAAYTGRPLYPMNCGELGADARSIENNLTKSFQRGHRWDCVLLLDEADVFLGTRDRANIERYRIVSIFLRKLEYYSGILILTSNRVGVFDPAILTRVHLAVKYSPLNEEGTKNLFKQNFQAIVKYNNSKTTDNDGDESEIDIDKTGI
jgi:SpoVK/Ycf46/Vps4 family AAA+-type ATPase